LANINKYIKSYEIYLIFTRLQSDSLESENIQYLSEFLKKHLGTEYVEQDLYDIQQLILKDSNYSPDSVYLKVERYLGYLDYQELKLLFQFIEIFLKKFPKPNYYINLLLLFCGRLLQNSTSIYITEQNFPNLFLLLKDIEGYTILLNRLDVLRSQASDLIRKETNDTPLPLSEILTQLTLLHCCYQYIDDDDLSVYNFLIKFARKSLSILSFQQVMRLCQNLNEFSKTASGVHLLFIEQINKNLIFDMRKNLIIELFKIKSNAKSNPECLQYFIDCVVTSCRFTKKEYASILFSHTEENTYDDSLIVFDVSESPINLVVNRHGKIELSAKSNDGLKCQLSSTSEISISDSDQTSNSDLVFKEGETYYYKGYAIISNPSKSKIACHSLEGTGLNVAGVDLCYKGNNILTDISINVRPGEMIAIVGPSGCGKSTMLTMLAGILEYSSGDIYFDGTRVSSITDFSKISTYIPQDDILFRELTVTESIESSLRLKIKTNEKEYNERLNSAIDVLGLERTRTLKIGNEGEKGISGGQRKRVNIGTTIVADMKPILLFDEPTSGLDPATDLEIMQLLRELSRKGHIVLCVTHNLSDESMGYFDKLMVLGENGKTQFFGKKQRAQYFFSIKSTQILFQKMKDAVHIDFHEKFYNSFEFNEMKSKVDNTKTLIDNAVDKTDIDGVDSIRTPSFGSSAFQFIKRETIRKFRDQQFLFMCLMQPILIGIFINWNFSGPFPNAIFSLITATLWIGAISGVREINGEIPQLKRDYMYGSSIFAYLLSKTSSCLAFSLFQALFLGLTVAYFGNYFQAPFNFDCIQLIIALSLLNLFGVCLGLLLSATIKSTLAAIGILPVLLIPLIIMGGALIRHNQTENFQSTVMKLNPLRITFESVFYSAENMLRPQLGRAEKRKPAKMEKQLKLYTVYREKLNLFNTDLNKYNEIYTEEDVNDIFSDMLSDDSESTDETPPPTLPAGLDEADLLAFQPKLWLDGLSLLPVDHQGSLSFLDIGAENYTRKYKILAPQAFSEDLSVQGATGMYQTQDKNSISIYSPADYIFYIIIELILMFLAMYYILRHKLSSKF